MGDEPFFSLKSLHCRGKIVLLFDDSFSLNVDVTFGFMVSFTCGGTLALISCFVFYDFMFSSLPCRASHF